MTNDTSTSQGTSQRPPSERPTPILERPLEGRVIAGVAAALARRHDIGLAWVRAGFVVACFFGGLGFLLYAVGWLVIPEEGERESVAGRYLGRAEGAPRWIGIGLIALAALIVLGWIGFIEGSLVWAAVLLVAGILLYRGDLDRGRRPPGPASTDPPGGPGGSADPSGEAAVGSQGIAGAGDGGAADLDDGGTGAPPPGSGPPAASIVPPGDPMLAVSPEDRRTRQPSVLGRLTVAAVLVTVGVMLAFDQAGLSEPTSAHYAGALIGVIGLGLLVGAWFGRARWLIVLGLLALPAVLFFSVVRIPFDAGWGEVIHRPLSVTEVSSLYRHSGGEFVLDLSTVDLGTDPDAFLEVEVEVGVGRVEVVLPPEVGLTATAEVGVGELDLLGMSKAGMGLEQSVEIAGDGTVRLRAELGAGQLTISRAWN